MAPLKNCKNKGPEVATKNNVRVPIPELVRAQLWVAAGGHCEFNCCNKPLDRNVITQQKVFSGQHAHIIGDSVHGPRGDAALSKVLAHDPANLMLVCQPCHWTIDRLPDDYPVELLKRMKKRHEDRIQRLYALDGTKDSVPVVLRHPIKQIHVPQFTDKDVQAAILTNSDFCHAPSEEMLSLDYRGAATREHDANYWLELSKQMREGYQAQMQNISHRARPSHLSVFAFAPMPLNMQLGAIIGNKIEVSTYQWDRIRESWLFHTKREFERQVITFNEVPLAQGRELALVMSLSGVVALDAVEAAVTGIPVVHFRVPRPAPTLVEDPEDVRHFRSKFTELMALVRNQGYRRIQLFPAMPLSLAVELGRQLLPKVDPEIHVWDLQNSRFVPSLQIQV